MVLHKYGERLYSGVQEALRSHLRRVAADVVNAQGTPFLQELVSRWNEHNKSTQMIRDILMVSSRNSRANSSSAALYVLPGAFADISTAYQQEAPVWRCCGG